MTTTTEKKPIYRYECPQCANKFPATDPQIVKCGRCGVELLRYSPTEGTQDA